MYQSGKTGDIMEIDDTPEKHMFLKGMLPKEGYSVQQRSGGGLALKEIQAQLSDIILLGIMMPEMDGYEVYRHLKLNPNTCGFPVIFIHSLNGAAYKVKGFQNGGADYITRPFQYEDVMIRIETHLTNRFFQKELPGKNILPVNEIWERKRTEIAPKKADKVFLHRKASLDDLNLIANRRQFDKILWHEWRRMAREKKPLSLIFADIDFFKNYNVTYGHVQGDECLKKVARCISEAVNRPADLPARYDDEKFAVILPNTELEGAQQVAEKIRQAVNDLHTPHTRSEAGQHVSLSIGVSCTVPVHRESPEQLIKDTDAALYEAKASGRDRIIVN